MFPGAEHAPRFGGAGLQMYLIGTEIAKDERFNVTFVFQGPVGNAHADRVSIVQPRPPIKRGVPFYSRRLNRQRALEPYAGGSRCVLISTMAHTAPMLVELARDLNAKSVFRVASELDVSAPLHATAEQRGVMLAAIAKADVVAVQTETQAATLSVAHGKGSVVIRKGIPVPSVPPNMTEKRGVLWVGSAQALKQPWYFLDLARDFAEESFTMVLPPADTGVYEYVRRRAQSVPNLELIDQQLPFVEVQRYFNQSRLFVYTSEFGTHPDNTVLQAAAGACGILSHALDPDGMFSVEGAGLRSDGSYHDLSRLLRRLLDSPSDCDKLGRAAFDYVQRVYGLERMADEYKELVIGMF